MKNKVQDKYRGMELKGELEKIGKIAFWASQENGVKSESGKMEFWTNHEKRYSQHTKKNRVGFGANQEKG